MGLLLGTVTFEKSAPTVAEVVRKIEEISGLAVIVADSSEDEYSTGSEIHFQCLPGIPVEICICDHDVGRRIIEQDAEDDPDYPEQLKQLHLSYVGPPHSQSVELQGCTATDSTLYGVTLLALEALGGQPNFEIPDETRAACGRIITEEELLKRHRVMERRMRKLSWQLILMLPILIPWYLICLMFEVIKMPFELYAIGIRMKQAESRV